MLKNPVLLIKRLVIAVCCLLIISVALVIALAIVVHNSSKQDAKGVPDCPSVGRVHEAGNLAGGVFDDMTADEIIAVRDFVLGDSSLNVTPIEKATIASNYIYLIELQQPSKDMTLRYLDDGGPKPVRKARVIIDRGGDDIPVVQEYIVEPADKPTKYSKLGHSIPFHKRVFETIPQTNILEKMVINLTKQIDKLLRESYDGYIYNNCTNRCLDWSHSQPAALQSGQHKVWIWFLRDTPGKYIHPVGLEALLDCPGTDPALWKVEMIFYNNQTFESAERLMSAYNSGSLQKVVLKAPNEKEALYSSYQRRGDPQPHKPARSPRQYEPDGKRYSIQGRHVEYMDWSFDFRARSSTGIQIFDIKFQENRIVYELSLQEAAAFYSGYSPMQMFTDYLDSGWGMGASTFELVPGVDCPESATFVDVIHFMNTPRPRRMKNAVCIFEYNTGIPLRRHYENDFKGGYTFYGGMPSNALVLRYISTPFNYDYILDYVFYQNGVLETRVSTTGYIQATHWTSKESPYGSEVHKNVAGNIHDHLLNYKVDLDVAMRKNSYETIDFERETIVNPWFPSRNRTQKVVRRRVKNTEQEALYSYNFEHPKYLNFFSETNLTNSGLHRGYRIQLRNVMKQIYPESLPLINAAKWSLHQVVVTKYKETELCSSSMFNQLDPYSPEVDFQTFYADNESIRNEDLVAWVTMGVMHLPHTEDMPNTATAGNSASFFLRPFNFFDEDPSMNSRDAVLLKPKDKAFSGVKVERFGTPQGQTCKPKEPPFKFTGTYDYV